MIDKNLFNVICVVTVLCSVSVLADRSWDSGGGADIAFENAANWDTDVLPTSSDNMTIDNGGTAVFSAASGTMDVKRGFLGEGSSLASGTLNVTGGTLRFSNSTQYASRIGRKGTGTLNVSGGYFGVGHRLQVGETGTGIVNLSGGILQVYREGAASDVAQVSLHLMQGDFNVFGGQFDTRGGVLVGANGIFSVQGGASSGINIGTYDDKDGFWMQQTGGTLEIGVNLNGVTKIFIDDVDDDGGSYATFEDGSILDVGYYDAGYGGGTWTVLELENGAITNNGLAFAESVDTNIWSFAIDNSGVNGLLTITAQGDPMPTGGDTFLIEAEDYTSQSGTSVEDCEDVGGGSDLGSIKDGAWCMYENIVLGTNALLNFRVARNSGKDDGHIEVWLDATNGTQVAQVDVPETGGWQEWQTVSTTIGAVDGAHDVYLVFSETSTTNNDYLLNFNWWSRDVGPTRVEVEDYTDGYGYNDEFEPSQDVGGGQSLGWISDGEWMEYNINVESAGLHKIDFRVASNTGGGSIEIVSDGATLGSVAVGETGGWYEWTTISTYVNFTTTGPQTLRLDFVSGGFNLNWFDYQLVDEIPVTLEVGTTRNQMMRYGMDYERLWYWSGSGLGPVPDWTVNDCNIDYIRTAISGGYELTEGVYKLDAYFGDDSGQAKDKIIPMMTAMQNANPNIKWFASPQPLDESASGASWQPYPIWITGATTISSGDYDFDPIKCAQYLIRYLRLMKHYGFKISYMDLTNEWQSNVGGGRLTQSDARDLVEYMKAYIANPPEPASDPTDPTGFYAANYPALEPGDMPLTVAPSSWELSQGESWISNLDTIRKREAIDIASSHNTNRDDGSGTEQEFADQVRATLGADTEVWQTEVHGWKNKHGANEVTSFDHMMRAIRAGFSGLNGWLALGGTSQGHTYLWHSSTAVTRGVKYYIFKKLSNTSNYGYNLDIDEPAELNNTMALIRDNLLTVWLNNASLNAVLCEIDLGGYVWSGEEITFTRWNEGLAVEGVIGTPIFSTSESLMAVVEGESLYCFEIPLADNEDNFPFVQAENYTTGSGVAVLPCSDAGGGDMVAFASADDEISFDLDITKTYPHDVAFRVSSENANITFDIYNGANLLASVNRVATGGDQNWTTIYQTIALDGGPMALRIVATGGGWNMNWIEFDRQFYSSGSELENLALNQSYSASNVYQDNSEYAAAMAFDGDLDTRWATDEAPAWIQVDFGTPTAINGVAFYDYNDRTEAYEIQYSDDGVTWYVAYEGGNPEDGTIYNFSTVTASKFRYQSISTPSGSPTIWEVEFYYDPLYTESDPAVASMAVEGNSLSLSWSGIEGATYALQQSTNLLEGFTTIESGIPVKEATNVNTVATQNDTAFYRVIHE